MAQRLRAHPGSGIRLHGRGYRLNLRRNGVRLWINLETDDYAEAVRRAAEVRAHPDLAAPGVSLLGEIERFIAYKLRMNVYTRHTAVTKRNKLKLLAAFLPPHLTAATVTARQVQAWHDSLVGQVSPTTISGYLMTAQAFFRWAVEVERLMRRSPMPQVKFVVTTGRARKSFCEFELRDALIAHAPTEELRLILYCGFHAGLRFNEIVQARPFWFDLRRRQVNLRQTATMKFKDREERSIPLTLEFAAFLQRYKLAEPFVLAPQVVQGKSLYRYDFRAGFMAYVGSSGFCCNMFHRMEGPVSCVGCKREIESCKWVTPHIMRHTFASLLVSAGESIYKVAVWMGDEVGTVQKHYGHLAPDHGGIEKAFSRRGEGEG